MSSACLGPISAAWFPKKTPLFLPICATQRFVNSTEVIFNYDQFSLESDADFWVCCVVWPSSPFLSCFFFSDDDNLTKIDKKSRVPNKAWQHKKMWLLGVETRPWKNWRRELWSYFFVFKSVLHKALISRTTTINCQRANINQTSLSRITLHNTQSLRGKAQLLQAA